MSRLSQALQTTEPAKKAGRAARLREATFKDYAQIALLESRFGLGTLESKSYERWVHLWQGNPLYRELEPGWSIGWVLEDENRKIVGSIGNIPLSYELQGRRILAASGRAWVAERLYRGPLSLSLSDRVINQRNVDLYLQNSISVRSLRAMSVFKCPRVPVGVWDECAFWITHYQGFLENILAMKNYRLAKPLSYPLSAAAFLKDRLTKKALRDSDVEVKACSGFDDRFDTFWEDLKRKNPHLLLAVRTREVLDWHFKYALLDNRLWIVTVVDGPRLEAYAIFDRTDNPKPGFKRVRLVDFQSLDGSTTLLSPILSWALRKCREEGIHMLENIGRWLETGEFIRTVAPYRRKLSNWIYFYRANNPALAASLADRCAWAPTLFEGDATL